MDPFLEAMCSAENAIFLCIAQSGTGKSTAVAALQKAGVRAHDLDAFGSTLYFRNGDTLQKGFNIAKALLLSKVIRGDLIMGSASNIAYIIDILSESRFTPFIFSMSPPTPDDLISQLSKRAADTADWVYVASATSYDGYKLPSVYGFSDKNVNWLGSFKLNQSFYDSMKVIASTQNDKLTQRSSSAAFPNFCLEKKKLSLKVPFLGPKPGPVPDSMLRLDLQSNTFPVLTKGQAIMVSSEGGLIGNAYALNAMQSELNLEIYFESRYLESASAMLFILLVLGGRTSPRFVFEAGFVCLALHPISVRAPRMSNFVIKAPYSTDGDFSVYELTTGVTYAVTEYAEVGLDSKAYSSFAGAFESSRMASSDANKYAEAVREWQESVRGKYTGFGVPDETK